MREIREKKNEEKEGRCINLLTRGGLRWWCRFADLQICKNYEKTSSLLKRSPDDNRKDFFRKDQGFVHSIRTSFFLTINKFKKYSFFHNFHLCFFRIHCIAGQGFLVFHKTLFSAFGPNFVAGNLTMKTKHFVFIS